MSKEQKIEDLMNKLKQNTNGTILIPTEKTRVFGRELFSPSQTHMIAGTVIGLIHNMLTHDILIPKEEKESQLKQAFDIIGKMMVITNDYGRKQIKELIDHAGIKLETNEESGDDANCPTCHQPPRQD